MSVYVDSLRAWGTITGYRGKGAEQAQRVGARHGHQWCHLFADESDSDELHLMAKRLGLRREWFQGDHYDIVPTKRLRAIALGAIELSDKAASEIWRRQKVASRSLVKP